MNTIKNYTLAFINIFVFIASLTGVAYANPITGTLNGQYFIMSGSDQDFNEGSPALATLNNLVQSNLGPNGLPIYNPASGYNFAKDQTASGEITWWSPSLNTNLVVSSTPTGTVNIPLNNSQMFPPAPGVIPTVPGFLTAHFTGSFDLAAQETLFLSLGADDDAFAYIDGNNISQIGGVHPFSMASTVSFLALAGHHTIDLFYADRNPTQAQLFFNLSDQTITVVAEPATALLLSTGILGLLSANQRRRLQKA